MGKKTGTTIGILQSTEELSDSEEEKFEELSQEEAPSSPPKGKPIPIKKADKEKPPLKSKPKKRTLQLNKS